MKTKLNTMEDIRLAFHSEGITFGNIIDLGGNFFKVTRVFDHMNGVPTAFDFIALSNLENKYGITYLGLSANGNESRYGVISSIYDLFRKPKSMRGVENE